MTGQQLSTVFQTFCRDTVLRETGTGLDLRKCRARTLLKVGHLASEPQRSTQTLLSHLLRRAHAPGHLTNFPFIAEQTCWGASMPGIGGLEPTDRYKVWEINTMGKASDKQVEHAAVCFCGDVSN